MIQRHGKTVLGIVLTVVILGAMILGTYLLPARAARPMEGSQSALAGSGGVTNQTFVKLSAAGTVVTATAVTDKVVGICELTASATANTKYAPVGTAALVTSGELIAVGDLLTAGAGGKAFVLDADDASTQRIAALALTAASGADEDVTVIVLASVAEQRLALTGDVTLTGDVGLAAGKDLELAAGAGYIQALGVTSGGIRIKPIDTGTAVTTMQNSNGAAGTLTLPLGTDTIVGRATTDTLTNKTVDGDDNTVQDLGVGVPKIMTTVNDATVGLPFIVAFNPSEAATLSYTVPAGKKLRVIDAWYTTTVGAGAHADDELTLQTSVGPAGIFDKEELNAVGDKTRGEFDNLDDASCDIAAAASLQLVANENAAGGCDALVYVLCVWVTP